MAEACDRKGKFWRGCKWRPQYDTEIPTQELREKIYGMWSLSATFAALGVEKRRFAGSICVTCGASTFAPAPTPEPAR